MAEYPEVAARFVRETERHEMKVLHDDGLYRHVRVWAPVSLDWFDLVTWPFNLIANGSHGSFHFCRFGPDTEDMFALFRTSGAGRRINPGYWAEKLRAGQHMSWSEAKFRTWLDAEAERHETSHPGLKAAVREQILDSDEHSLEYVETAEHAVYEFSHKGFRLRVPESWDVSFEDFDWRYLWSCHAIVAGIQQYDAHKAALVGGGSRG